MKLKKITTLVTALSVINVCVASKVSAQEWETCTSTGGSGYTQCCKAPPVAAAVTLGAVALAGVIIVALQKSRGDLSHSSHSSSTSSVSSSSSSSTSG